MTSFTDLSKGFYRRANQDGVKLVAADIKISSTDYDGKMLVGTHAICCVKRCQWENCSARAAPSAHTSHPLTRPPSNRAFRTKLAANALRTKCFANGRTCSRIASTRLPVSALSCCQNFGPTHQETINANMLLTAVRAEAM